MAISLVARDARNLNDVLSEIDKETNKSAKDILEQGMALAVRSAAVATTPKGNADIQKMGMAHRFRPIEKMVGVTEFWYKKENKKGKDFFFRSKKKISTKKKIGKKGQKKSRGITKLKKGIKYWRKSKKRWDYLPTESTKKYDKSIKNTRIKFAGVGKLGWMKALPQFRTLIRANKELNRVTKRFGGTDKSIRIDNLVDYVSKTSPESASIGIRSAGNRMIKQYKIANQKLINRLNSR
jgi:hypothetical protein